MFMNWIKGVLMHKGIAHIMEAAFKNVLPESENASRQTFEQNNLMSKYWPSGIFNKVIDMLNKKYRPKDTTSRVMQKKESMVLKLKGSGDPDEFGTDISRLEIEYKHTLTEEDKVTSLVGTVGLNYVPIFFN